MIAAREGSVVKAKPSNLQAAGRIDRYRFASKPVYTDIYVEGVKGGLEACKVRAQHNNGCFRNANVRSTLSSIPSSSSVGLKSSTT